MSTLATTYLRINVISILLKIMIESSIFLSLLLIFLIEVIEERKIDKNEIKIILKNGT